MTLPDRLAIALLAAMSCAANPTPKAPEPVEPDKPTLTLTASPPLGFARVVTLRASLRGPEAEDWYCRPIEWRWPDGTRSTHTEDCPPWAERAPWDYERSWVRRINLGAPGEYEFGFALLKTDGSALATASAKVEVSGGG